MSVFLAGDRALPRDDRLTCLESGRLYFVERVQMSSNGVQALHLLGSPVPWQASRFQRVPDPSPRRWPVEGGL